MNGVTFAPTQKAQNEPREMIRSYALPTQSGEYVLEMPKDADVFAVGLDPGHVAPESAEHVPASIRMFATVTVLDYETSVNPDRARIFWVAGTGSILPGGKYSRESYRKTYVGSVAGIGAGLHIWEIARR